MIAPTPIVGGHVTMIGFADLEPDGVLRSQAVPPMLPSRALLIRIMGCRETESRPQIAAVSGFSIFRMRAPLSQA